MSHPFSTLTGYTFRRLLWFLFALTALFMFTFNVIGQPLTTEQAPYGIVSFELVKDVAEARAVLSSWNASAQLRAAFIQGLDCLFAFIYSTAFSLACLGAGRLLKQSLWPLSGLAPWIAWGQGLAALCDLIENISLTVMLFGVVQMPWPVIARWNAIIKFSLLFAGLVYIFYGGVIYLAHHRQSSAQDAQP
jgi:hypothetical protein